MFASCQEDVYANVEPATVGAYCRLMASTIAQRLKAARKKRKLSQARLAHLIGRKRGSDVSQWETGMRKPTPESLEAIAKALQLPVSELDPDNEAYDREAPRNKTVVHPTIGDVESGSQAQAEQDVQSEVGVGAMAGRSREDLMGQLAATVKRLPLKKLQEVTDFAMLKDLARREVHHPAKKRQA